MKVRVVQKKYVIVGYRVRNVGLLYIHTGTLLPIEVFSLFAGIS